MLDMFRQLKKLFLDTIFPIFCLGCGKEGYHLCNDCLDSIKVNEYPICPICGRRLIDLKPCSLCAKKTHLNGLMVANLDNNKLLRQAIYGYKYKFIKELSEPLTNLLIHHLRKSFVHQDFQQLSGFDDTIIIPVPLHSHRLNWRGFNQSQLMAENIVKQMIFSDGSTILLRQKNNQPQKNVPTKKERQTNIENAFAINLVSKDINTIRGKTIILVDDICTSGSTLEECAKVLRQLKPKSIWGLVLTKG